LLELVLAVTVKIAVPLPLPPVVFIVTHDTFDVAVQGQPAPVATLIEPPPPEDGNELDRGDRP
jgi:hypothetical protein